MSSDIERRGAPGRFCIGVLCDKLFGTFIRGVSQVTVAYVQLFIVAVLLGTFLLSRALSFRPVLSITIVATLLTIFTFSAVHTNRLLAVQLIIIWGTWFCLRVLQGKNYQIGKLQGLLDGALAGLPDDVNRHASLALSDKQQYRVLVGSEHRRVLIDSLEQVQKNLIIFSGWIAARVVDNEFLSRLTGALDRGANVHLVFGYQPPAGLTKSDPSHEQAVKRLRKLAERSAEGKTGVLTVRDLSAPGAARFGNHAKVLICDGRFAVCGSNNWLANRKFANAEVSVLFTRSEIVEEITDAVRGILVDSRA